MFVFFLLSVLAIASTILETGALRERGLVLQDRAPRGGSRVGLRTKTVAAKNRKTRTKKKYTTRPKKTAPGKTTLKKST